MEHYGALVFAQDADRPHQKHHNQDKYAQAKVDYHDLFSIAGFGNDVEHQAVHFFYANALSCLERRAGAHAPGFAVDVRPAFVIEILEHFAA